MLTVKVFKSFTYFIFASYRYIYYGISMILQTQLSSVKRSNTRQGHKHTHAQHINKRKIQEAYWASCIYIISVQWEQWFKGLLPVLGGLGLFPTTRGLIWSNLSSPTRGLNTWDKLLLLTGVELELVTLGLLVCLNSPLLRVITSSRISESPGYEVVDPISVSCWKLNRKRSRIEQA